MHCTWYWPHYTFTTYYIHLVFTVLNLVWSDLNFIFFLLIWYSLYPIWCDLNHNWKHSYWFGMNYIRFGVLWIEPGTNSIIWLFFPGSNSQFCNLYGINENGSPDRIIHTKHYKNVPEHMSKSFSQLSKEERADLISFVQVAANGPVIRTLMYNTFGQMWCQSVVGEMSKHRINSLFLARDFAGG